MFDIDEIYSKNRTVFERYEYDFERYGIKYTVALLKLNSKLKDYDIRFRDLVRKSDDKIYINSTYRLLVFMNTDIKGGYDALLTLEKEIIQKYKLYNFCENIFNAALAEKKRGIGIKDILDKIARMIKNISEDCLVVTEDDIC